MLHRQAHDCQSQKHVRLQSAHIVQAALAAQNHRETATTRPPPGSLLVRLHSANRLCQQRTHAHNAGPLGGTQGARGLQLGTRPPARSRHVCHMPVGTGHCGPGCCACRSVGRQAARKGRRRTVQERGNSAHHASVSTPSAGCHQYSSPRKIAVSLLPCSALESPGASSHHSTACTKDTGRALRTALQHADQSTCARAAPRPAHQCRAGKSRPAARPAPASHPPHDTGQAPGMQ